MSASTFRFSLVALAVVTLLVAAAKLEPVYEAWATKQVAELKAEKPEPKAKVIQRETGIPEWMSGLGPMTMQARAADLGIDLNCDDFEDTDFEAIAEDPHGLDGYENDGIACES